jgi:transposase InsO family protein
MTESQKEDIAVFRFGVIHEFVGGTILSREEKKTLLQEKCARKWVIPYSHRTRISPNTIYRWIRRYQKSGGKLSSLYPGERKDQGASRCLDSETISTIVTARKASENETLPVPLFLEKLKNRHLVPQSTSLSSIYRLLHQNGLMDKTPAPEDRRKFEAELPNDMWQSDVMHGPQVAVNGKSRKTYLIAFIDDHSRLILHAGFYLSENLESFMDAFEKALAKRGLPRKLYVDNGSAYRSHKLEFTCASLGIALIHARPYKPQGKGKIERFFKTVRSQFLSQINSTDLPQLNQAFATWLEDVYHQRKHSATAMTPFRRYSRNLTCIRQAPANLKDHFRKAVQRTVAKDRTITLDGRLFEAPTSLIGKRVLLLYHENEPSAVEVFWQKVSYGLLVPVNLAVNCRVKRDKKSNAEIESTDAVYQGGELWK